LTVTLADELLPDLDTILGIPDELGLCPFTVTVYVSTWSGSAPGLGTRTTTSTVLTNAQGTRRVVAQRMKASDVVASGGVYTADDWKIGPFAQPAPGSGVSFAQVNPPTSGNVAEVFYRIDGPAFPSTGGWYQRKADMIDDALMHWVIVEKTASKPNVS
jgi:hypothetical protein